MFSDLCFVLCFVLYYVMFVLYYAMFCIMLSDLCIMLVGDQGSKDAIKVLKRFYTK